jgi:hypothetical protein
VESKFIRTIAVDPVIAAILGVANSAQIVHMLNYQPSISARLSRTMRNGVVYAGGGRQITPGNGLFQTSFSTTFMAGYGYTGLRRWSITGSVAYNSSRAVGTIQGQYGSETATAGISRQIFQSFHFVASYSLRRYDSNDFAGYHRLVQQARIGIGFTPSDIPLRIW